VLHFKIETALSPASQASVSPWRVGFWWLLSLFPLTVFGSLPLSEDSQATIAFALLGALSLSYFWRLRLPKDSSVLPWLRFFLVFTSLALGLRYFYWRATETLPFGYGLASSLAGLLLFAVEIYGFVTFVFGHFINAQPLNRTPLPCDLEDPTLPTVDVFVPTYNEDPSVLRPTIIAATQMHYPKDRFTVWILDDGGTDQKRNDKDPIKATAARQRARELQEMAAELGANYLTRARNEHAKAGNLNHALTKTHGKLLLILDCDHIPTRDFLVNTVPFFKNDPKLFLLQTPHNFVTPDPVERNLKIFSETPAENELFYTVMQPGLDFWGTSFFCGSAAVLRREALDRVGGIAGETITEDAETTLDAIGLGYRTAYLNRPMVSGLQPETYSGLIVQRVRWGQGMLQIFLLKNPWLQKNLHFVQRLLYTNFATYWGFAVARLLLFFAPPAYLIFGLDLCDTTAGQLLAYAGPYYLASLVSTQFYYREVRWPFISQIYETIQSVYVTQGIFRVLRRPRSPSFQVTPKGERLDSHFVSSLSGPFYVFLAMTVASLVGGVWRWQAYPWMHGAIVFVMIWAILDLLFILAALGVLYEKPQRRSEPRAWLDEEVDLYIDGRHFRAHAVDGSRLGIGLELRFPSLNAGDRQRVLALFRKAATLSLAFADGKTLAARIENRQWRTDRHSLSLGLAYRFADIRDERYAVDLAFGDSARLQDNLDRRHQGKSIPGALAYIAALALTEGPKNIGWQLRHMWERASRAGSGLLHRRKTQELA
jgi:cellulose synthase (UDP-forming)